MGKPKASKLRWKRLPHDLRVTCYSDGCSNLTRVYCKRADCREPYCDKHKGEHILNAHTVAKLAKTATAGGLRIDGFDELPKDRQVEIMSLVAKIRRRRDVEQSDVGIAAPGTFVAWAVVRNALVEKRSNRIEEALHDLYVELRAIEPPRRPRPVVAQR